jgi:hypothetical protein
MTLPVSHVDEDPFLTIKLSVVLLLGHIDTQTTILNHFDHHPSSLILSRCDVNG